MIPPDRLFPQNLPWKRRGNKALPDRIVAKRRIDAYVNGITDSGSTGPGVGG
jgi:hypothetical protein